MCHRSVGLVQGAIEAAGISTVSLTLRPEITFHMRISRAAYVRFPLGNPLGEPNRADQHHLVLGQLLELLERAHGPETVVELPFRWRRWDRWLR
jgi:D-proline reductase (dithiol) PrdB